MGDLVHAPTTLKICHLADVHLGFRRYNRLTRNGFNQREVDVTSAFRESVDQVIEINPDLVLIAGDLFHTVRPSNTIVTICFRELSRLINNSRAEVIISAGNHESPRRSDTGCILRLFEQIDRVHVSDLKLDSFKFPQLSANVTCLPHRALQDIDTGRIRADDQFKYNILMLHAQVDQSRVTDFGGVNFAFDNLNPHEWDYIALGHVHTFHEVAYNAYYSGAIERSSNNIWVEANEPKGFLEVELPSRTIQHRELSSPRTVINLTPIMAASLEPEELDELIKERLEEVPGGIDGKLVRLEILEVARPVYRRLNHRELRRYRSKALHLALEFKVAAVIEHSLQSSEDSARTIERDLQEFAAGWEKDGVKGEKILPIIQRYLSRQEEKSEITVVTS